MFQNEAKIFYVQIKKAGQTVNNNDNAQNVEDNIDAAPAEHIILVEATDKIDKPENWKNQLITNNVMMQYLAWRVCTGLHKNIILSFLPHGHTKSLQTGWGRKYKTLEIETMDELRQDTESSTPSNHINQAFHTGPEKGLQHTSDKIFCLD